MPLPWPLPDRYEIVEHTLLQRGSPEIGYLNVAYLNALPFEVRRVFWVTQTPSKVIRGGHAHYQTEQLLVAISGSIEVQLEWPDGRTETYTANNPNRAVYIAPYAWHEMTYGEGAVQLVLASTEFEPSDYIRDKQTWHDVYKTAN